jgi:MFS family permease
LLRSQEMRFFADVVPPEWRAHVVGTRNAMLAAATTITSLLSGQILAHTTFPSGYQIVFAIGFVGSALSCMHLFLIRPAAPEDLARVTPAPSPAPGGLKSQLRFEILRGPFGLVLLLLVAYNLSVFISQPVFPLYQVNVLKFTDQTISLGTSIFWVVYFIGSIRVGGLARRIGNQKLTALGIAMTSISTLLFILSFHPAVYVACQLVGGAGWSFLGVGVINYLLENVPANDRTPHLSWYNLAINAANLGGAMLGSGMASRVGMLATLIFVVTARLLSGAAILRWGNPQKDLPASPEPDKPGSNL